MSSGSVCSVRVWKIGSDSLISGDYNTNILSGGSGSIILARPPRHPDCHRRSAIKTFMTDVSTVTIEMGTDTSFRDRMGKSYESIVMYPHQTIQLVYFESVWKLVDPRGVFPRAGEPVSSCPASVSLPGGPKSGSRAGPFSETIRAEDGLDRIPILSSDDLRFTLFLGLGRDLLYIVDGESERKVWSFSSVLRSTSRTLSLQLTTGGNLRLTSDTGILVWQSGSSTPFSSDTRPCHLTLADNGHLSITDGEHAHIWDLSRLSADDVRLSHEFALLSCNMRYTARVVGNELIVADVESGETFTKFNSDLTKVTLSSNQYTLGLIAIGINSDHQLAIFSQGHDRFDVETEVHAFNVSLCLGPSGKTALTLTDSGSLSLVDSLGRTLWSRGKTISFD